jgi:hypothetical protein
MTSLRITLTTLALAAAGLAHASEITEFKVEPGMLARAEVQAQARLAQPSNQLYDGTQAMPAAAPMAAKSRAEVRLEATAALVTRQAGTHSAYVGGM